MNLNNTPVKLEQELIREFLNTHKNNLNETENLDNLYVEFEDFLGKFCGINVSEEKLYQRQKLGHYFNLLDEYFKFWLNVRLVYSKAST